MNDDDDDKRGRAWLPILTFAVMVAVLFLAFWLLVPEPGSICPS